MGKIRNAITGVTAFFVSAAIHAALIGGIIYASYSAKASTAPVKTAVAAQTARSYALLPDVEIVSGVSALKRGDTAKTTAVKKEDFGSARAVPDAGGDNERSSFVYQDAVMHRIQEARLYPEDAKKEGSQGAVLVLVSILPDGTLAQVSLLKSSGKEVLDQEALSTVKRASPFPVFDRSMKEEKFVRQFSILFKLD